jgi:hypothetical protein
MEMHFTNSYPRRTITTYMNNNNNNNPFRKCFRMKLAGGAKTKCAYSTVVPNEAKVVLGSIVKSHAASNNPIDDVGRKHREPISRPRFTSLQPLHLGPGDAKRAAGKTV